MADRMVVATVSEVRALVAKVRGKGERLGFVPTMGALHAGHLALVKEARRHASFVVCSIFVNPTQFGPNEDFARYPRDLAGDVAKLEGVDLVFAPEVGAMYPPGDESRVNVTALAAHLCGPHRPGHFEGVATVVAKLFGIVQPDVAVFGKKDYQQLAILRRMVTDLFMPITLVGHPIVREQDGLAMSSRNAYLSADERARALSLSRGLAAAVKAHAAGERRAGALRDLVHREVAAVATSIDYVSIADPDALAPIEKEVGDRALAAIACRIGSTRLIDNVVLGEDPSPVPPA